MTPEALKRIVRGIERVALELEKADITPLEAYLSLRLLLLQTGGRLDAIDRAIDEVLGEVEL